MQNTIQHHSISPQHASPAPTPVRLVIGARPWGFLINLDLVAVAGNKFTCLLSPELISETLSAKDIYNLLTDTGDYTLQLDDAELSYGGEPLSARLIEKVVHPNGLLLSFLIDDHDTATALFGARPTPQTIAWT